MSSLPPGASRLGHLDGAWEIPGHGPRLRAVCAGAEQLRDSFAGGPRILGCRTFSIATFVYPSRYALNGFALSPAPFVSLVHRATLVQFMQGGQPKMLLFNPTDVEAAKSAPFFARLIEQFGERVTRLVTKTYEPLEAQLQKMGISAGAIDYVAFDHFHTQDLRSLVGTVDGARGPRFPNATLLAPRVEWDDWDDLHPYQRAWFVHDGKKGVRETNIVFTREDYMLGDGVMLVRTPGHTSGNQTLFLNTEQGVWGISENGTCADSWAPLDSAIRGLASHCRRQDLELVINSNTPEGGAQQYTSMMLERTMVDRLKRAPAFVQMFPSSEVTPIVTAPGLSPTVLHRRLSMGDISLPTQRDAAAE